MATITTRVQGASPKGSPLTNAEVDDNFINLNTAKYESGSNASFGTLAATSNVNFSNKTVHGASHGNAKVVLETVSASVQLKLSRTNNIDTTWETEIGSDELGIHFWPGTYTGNAQYTFGADTKTTVLNEKGADIDFRVESDTNGHALFLNAGNSRVGINNSNPIGMLDVSGGSIYAGNVSTANISGTYKLVLSSGTSTTYNVTDGNDVGIKLGSGYIWNVNGNGSYNGMTLVTNHEAYSGQVTTGLPSWAVSIGSRNAADTGEDTFSVLRMDAGGAAWRKKLTVYNASTVINEDSTDHDFRVESDANTAALFVDAGNSRVGINRDNPSYTLDVVGSLRTTEGALLDDVFLNAYLGTIADTKKGYVILARVDSGSLVNTMAIDGRFHIHRGHASSFRISEYIDICAKRAYNAWGVERFNTYNMNNRLVTLTYNSVDYYAIEFYATSSRAIYFSGWYVDDRGDGNICKLIQESAVTNVVQYMQGVRLNIGAGSSSEVTIGTADRGTFAAFHPNAITFNDGSYDIDFRVESDVNANSFYVSGETGNVGINNGNPQASLHVTGGGIADYWQTNGGDGSSNSANQRRYSYTLGNTSNSGATWRKVATIYFSGSTGTSWEGTQIEFRTYIPNSNHGYYAYVNYEYVNLIGITRKVGTSLLDTALIHGPNNPYLRVYRVSETVWEIQLRRGVDNQSIFADFVVRGISGGYLEGTEGTVAGTDSGGATYTANNDNYRDGVYGVRGSASYDGSLIVNEVGGNYDFRVESDAKTHMLFVDASANSIGINNSAPSFMLDLDGRDDALRITNSVNGGRPSMVFRNRYVSASPGVQTMGQIMFDGFRDVRNPSYICGIQALNSSTGTANTGTLVFMAGQNGEDTLAELPRERLSVGYYGFTFNEPADDADFRIESVNNSNCVYLNASEDRLFIGKTTISDVTTTGAHIGVSGTMNLTVSAASYGAEVITINNVQTNGYCRSMDFRHLNGSIGYINQSSTSVTYNTTSDRRLKENIAPIADGTAKVMAMNPVTHTWIAHKDAPAVHGFIAQEMQEIVPEAVSGTPDGEEMMAMDYGRITPVLVAALQDAHKKIAELEARLTALEGK